MKTKILIVISILLSCLPLVNFNNEIRYEYPCEYTLVDKINMWAKGVKEITVPPEQFAKYVMIVFWCESRLNKNNHNGTQQSLFQITKRNRELLGIPELDDCTEQEVLDYYYLYLKETKKLHLVKSALDLHVLNAAPSRFNKETLLHVRGNLKYLDYDKNKIINRKDLAEFQLRCCRESAFLQCLIQQY